MTFKNPEYPFTPKTININGHNLSYLDEGEGHAIVMVHGNPTWSFFYRNLVSSLRDRYRVIALDHLGCGLSDKPQDYPYTLQNHIANLTNLIDHLGLKKITLVVHDWGGAIGMGFAGRNPQRISSMVVLNTAAFSSSQIPFRIAVCRVPFIGALLVRGLNGFSRPAISMASTKGLSDDACHGYLYPYDSWQNRVAVHSFVRDIPLTSDHQSWGCLQEVENNLSKLTSLPMLILWGGKDFCFNDHFFKEWQKRFPASERHYFPDAGHYLLDDAFAQVKPLVQDFLEGNSG